MNTKFLKIGIASIIAIALGSVFWQWFNAPQITGASWTFAPVDDYNAKFLCLRTFVSMRIRYSEVTDDSDCSGEMDANFRFPGCNREGKDWICDTPMFADFPKATPEQMEIGARWDL